MISTPEQLSGKLGNPGNRSGRMGVHHLSHRAFSAAVSREADEMKVLVIEDDLNIGKSVQKGLSEAGHDCTWIRDGKSGLIAARAQKFDAIVLDLLLPSESGLGILEKIRGQGINTPVSRTIGVRLLHAPVVSMAARARYTDTTNGFRAYSRRLVTDPRVAPLRDVFVGYELHYYLAIRSARLGFRIIETPVTRRYPKSGKTPTKISPVKGSLNVLRTLAAAAAGRFDP